MAIDLSRSLLVVKPTKVEFDGARLGLSARRLAAYYGPQNAEVIFSSHERQLAMRERLLRLLPEARPFPRSRLSPAALRRANLVVALGGDNHFTYVARFLERTPVLGVNADLRRSHGGLLSVDERNLDSAAEALRAGRLRPKEWTRLEASVAGRPAGRALSEILVAEAGRKDMSRHALRLDREPEEEHKSSGLLVATGAGSTGWYGHYGRPFPPDAGLARWALTEPFPRGRRLRRLRGTLRPGQVLRLRSLNDARGTISLDCLGEFPFPYGSTAEIRLSRVPLSVLEAR